MRRVAVTLVLDCSSEQDVSVALHDLLRPMLKAFEPESPLLDYSVGPGEPVELLRAHYQTGTPFFGRRATDREIPPAADITPMVPTDD